MVKKIVKHIFEEGSRQHVISWYGVQDASGKIGGHGRCSEPNCEINKEG